MEYQLSVSTNKSPAEAVKALEQVLSERKFAVLWHLDVNRQLEEKGFNLGPEVHILEVCSAPKAKHAIESNPDVTYFLPCKIVVRRENGQTTIGIPRPSMLMTVLGDERLQGLAAEVEDHLWEAVQAAK